MLRSVRWSVLAGPAALLGGTAAVLWFDPFEDHGRLGCPFHEMTGLLCPGCGITRAWWLLVHGDLVGVLHHNLLFLPALAWLVTNWFVANWPDRSAFLPLWSRSPTEIPPRALHALAVFVVAFAVLRNLPAFSWLAPSPT